MGHYISPTQISDYLLCQRKWAHKRIDKVQAEQNESAALGSEVHEQLECYLKGGDLDFTRVSGEIAAAGLEHIPAPLTAGMRVEGKNFQFDLENITYIGKIDVDMPPGTWQELPVIIDHKTTKDFKWVKSPEELQKDVQANVYAAYAMIKYQTDSVYVKWVYYKTKKPYKSKPVHLTMYRPQVEEQFKKLHLTAQDMVAILESGKRALDLPPTPDACEAFGGCPYRHICNLSPLERMRSAMAQSADDLIARLRAKNGISTPNTQPPTVPAMPAVKPMPAAVPYVPAAYAKPGQPTAPPVLGATGINPPPDPVLNVPATPPAPSVPIPPPTPAPTDVPTLAAEPAKRGRPRKPKTEPPPAEDPRQVKMFHTETETPAPTETTPVPFAGTAQLNPSKGYLLLPPSEKPIGILYIDCAPNIKYETAFDLFYEANLLVEKEYKVSDWRAVQYTSGAALTAAVKHVLKEHPVGSLVVDSNTAEAVACLSTLCNLAQVVVR